MSAPLNTELRTKYNVSAGPPASPLRGERSCGRCAATAASIQQRPPPQ